MVDRRTLKKKAKSAGSSVAGTFKAGAEKAKQAGKNFAKTTKRGAKNLARDIQGKSKRGKVDIIYSNEAEQYFVTGYENEQIGVFEDKMEASAAARQYMRDRDNGQGETEQAGGAKQGFQRFATNFAESVNNAAEIDDEGREPQLPGMGGDGEGDQSEGAGPALPIFASADGEETGEPFVPSFGMGDKGGEPMVPDLGANPGGDGPKVPDLGASDGEDRQPIVPDLGPPMDDSEADEDQPWMF